MYLNIPPERDCLDAPLLSMDSKRDKQQQSGHPEYKVAPGMQTILAKVATPQNHPVAVKSDRYIIHSVILYAFGQCTDHIEVSKIYELATILD